MPRSCCGILSDIIRCCLETKVYKFVGVNIAHLEFIRRYYRLGPQELGGPDALANAGDDAQFAACDRLASHLLLRRAHDPDTKTKFEIGRTKIFIRCINSAFSLSHADCATTNTLCAVTHAILQRRLRL